jgi:hypothetical protein
MRHIRSGAQETGSTTIGGEVASIHHVGTNEATHCSRVNEKIIEEAHSPMTY